MIKTILLFVSALTIHANLLSQDISTHKWQDRVLIIFADEEGGHLLKKQIEILKSDEEELEDRKLVVYSINGSAYRKGINSNEWVHGSDTFEAFKDSENNFNVILIGLDGGIKINQSEVLSLDELFSTIDAMPMRRSELRTRNQ